MHDGTLHWAWHFHTSCSDLGLQLMLCCVTFCLQKAKTEFENFETLFGRFLRESGTALEWDKIKLLADDAVSPLFLDWLLMMPMCVVAVLYTSSLCILFALNQSRCPDMTFAVDWALKANYLSILLINPLLEIQVVSLQQLQKFTTVLPQSSYPCVPCFIVYLRCVWLPTCSLMKRACLSAF